MAVDILQEKIRKLKNPMILELFPDRESIPAQMLNESEHLSDAVSRFCRELLSTLKDTVPGVRFSFGGFALLGAEGMQVLQDLLGYAKKLGYYVLLDGPELLSPRAAELAAEVLLGKDSQFICDGLVIGSYLGSDILKPFLTYILDGKKDIFVVARTANKSAPELQDLLSGGRLVHAVATDQVNRFGGDTVGKFGYTRVGIVAAASSMGSLRNLRGKYPKLFILLDGADYPNANAKNCANAFDKFGHGAASLVGTSVTQAWKVAQTDGSDYQELAKQAAERMRRNLTRYVTIL